ncbi:hypothetical protein [Aeoliella mucimassa]|uniref:Uncharacterized protein n=1 Tax=Aeoliella mucimassa TaxID=2527972 RepID=A0A518AGX4_9BACT|nr:hypothetical protein [Aeoliella mucimassa]QDU53983.1 hypothetical protein Pan181_01620 [Aeoliella mucimassa]
MSQPDLTNGPVRTTSSGQKSKATVYTALLGIAAMCLAIGCIMLMIEIGRYASDAGVTSGWFGVIK